MKQHYPLFIIILCTIGICIVLSLIYLQLLGSHETIEYKISPQQIASATILPSQEINVTEKEENNISEIVQEDEQYNIPEIAQDDDEQALEYSLETKETDSEKITPEDETNEETDSSPQEYTQEEVIKIIEQAAKEYNVPLWFLKAIVRRESSFNNTEISYDDGIEGEENWNMQRDCSFTEDKYPHGLGLTKLTGWMYQGSFYPFCLETPDNNNEDYYYAMRMQDYGTWIDMNDVTALTDPFDPKQNLERFLTGYAIPAHDLFATQYPNETEEELWRRVAFHWNKGLYVIYDSNNTDYLALYDSYTEEYQNE